jgi:hypothetical protein
MESPAVGNAIHSEGSSADVACGPPAAHKNQNNWLPTLIPWVHPEEADPASKAAGAQLALRHE